jgi:phage gp29-like protein
MKLYDAYGREVDTAQLRDEHAAPTIAGVRNIYSVMHPSTGLTPEKLIAIQREAEAGDPYLYLELAEEMEEKDLHYLAVISTRKQAVAGAEIIVTPASEAAEDLRAADLVRDFVLGGAFDLEGVLFDILDAVGKGFSATEIIWDTAGREWIPKRLAWRDPRWFMFDWISGEELLVRTLRDEGPLAPADVSTAWPSDAPSKALSNAPDGSSPHYRRSRWYTGVDDGARIGIQPLTAPLAPFKFIVHAAKAKAGLPVRGGIARAAGWAYLFKNYVLKDWVTFAEVFGQPLRLGKYAPGATEADKHALLSAVANIGTDAAAIIPESMLIEFVEARQAGGAEVYERFCEYLDKQVSKAVLGQTLTTETPREGGSRAAAQVHDAVRRDIMESDARRLGATLTRDLVRPIVDLNLGPQRRYPQIALGLSADNDVKLFADMVAELADRGLRVGQRAVLRRLGLPEPAADEPLLEPAAAAARRA